MQSVSEDIYDSFILREIAEQPEQFKMAIVIGNVLGKYQLGISDVWISNRIDKMLEDAARAANTGNMQTYSVIVSTDPEEIARLAPAHFNQPAITGAKGRTDILHRFQPI